MPVWLKILLIIFLFFVMVAIGVAFFGYRWVRSHEGELRQMGEQAKVEGETFGRSGTADACIAETLARGGRCGQMNIMCEAKAKLFLDHCLNTAEKPADFCAGVPKPTEIVASVKWATGECARRGQANDQRCGRLIGGIQDYCARR